MANTVYFGGLGNPATLKLAFDWAKTQGYETNGQETFFEQAGDITGAVFDEILVNNYLFKINSIRIFELEGNKPSPVKQGKIRIKDTGYIVYTDLLGYVISGSTPPLI
jgi:hypothetical protein